MSFVEIEAGKVLQFSMGLERNHAMMPASVSIPAGQYLRVSTDRQEYSLENQAQAVGEYAESHGLRVVNTYSDPAILQHRGWFSETQGTPEIDSRCDPGAGILPCNSGV